MTIMMMLLTRIRRVTLPDYSVVWAVTLPHSIPHSFVVWTNLNIHQYLHWHRPQVMEQNQYYTQRREREIEAVSQVSLVIENVTFWFLSGGRITIWQMILDLARATLHTPLWYYPDRSRGEVHIHVTWKILSIINIYDQFDHPYHTHWLIGGRRTLLVTRHSSSGERTGETESLRAEKMTRKEIMSEECAVRPSFNMCEILFTPGKDFIIQVSQPRLVGIMGAILAFRDKLVWRGRGERGLVRGSHKMRSVRCKIYCHIMTNS